MQIVIIGNSAAGLSALETIRKYDRKSFVTMISKETERAYSRVLLPYHLTGKLSLDRIFIRKQNYYKEMQATILKDNVLFVDDNKKTIELEDNQNLRFDRLLIATGSSAVKPPIPGLDGPQVFHLWTLEDIELITPLYVPGKRVLFLGSGFTTLKAASAAVECGLEVSVYELMPRIMPRMLDDHGASIIHKRILEKGVNLQVETTTERVERKPDGTLVVQAKDREPLEVDFVIVGTGVRPNIGLLHETAVKTDRGILVNDKMQSSNPCIYAAGDVAQGPTAFAEQHQIHALWPTAVEMGKIAGANIAGKSTHYRGSLNMNVTELFGLTAASMGRFIEDNGNQSHVYADQAENGYLKVVFENGTPIGGTAVGKAELVPYLGMLRPMIRTKHRPSCRPEQIFQKVYR